MKRDFKAIAGKTFDVIIIGGGIVGAGVARDTTLRGLDTLLLEKEDFAYGTTSRSTRLIHGGLRYLRQLEFKLVRQDLSEREVLLRIAPNLVRPLAFLIPVPNIYLNVAMFFGTMLYDIISFDKTLPSHRFLSKGKTLTEEPGLEVKGLQGSYEYYDCQVAFPERLNFETALSASENGASVINHARVIGLLRDGNRICGVEVKDEITSEILQVKGKLVVNAAGHWVDLIKNMVFDHKPPYLRRTKGVHLVIPQVSRNALVLFSPRDSRLFFVIPWEGYSLVGTTDTDYKENLDAVYATNEDVNYLLDGLHIAYPKVTIDDVYYTTAGLRSLALKPGKSASDTSRSHELIDHSKLDGLDGFVTVLGGKITAYREVAKDATDMVCRKLGNKARCITGEKPLPGAPAIGQDEISQFSTDSALPINTVQHLVSIYGSRYREVINLLKGNTNGKQPISSGGPDIIAQIWYAVQNESVFTINDFMLRRGMLGFRSDLGLDAVDNVGQEMKRLLGWTTEELQKQIQSYKETAALTRRFKTA
ncbi:MAG: glycerol-3-phosphate dehydrogenase/oxidase [Chloroflexi bacterium]|nr:glycerol-3-phosphate dehydrogenase/oxidase [Chloroflexota bacterium]